MIEISIKAADAEVAYAIAAEFAMHTSDPLSVLPGAHPEANTLDCTFVASGVPAGKDSKKENIKQENVLSLQS